MAFRDLEHLEAVAVTAHNAVTVLRTSATEDTAVVIQSEVNCILYPIGKLVAEIWG